MGVSRATSQAAVPSGGHASPFDLLEFAVSQAVSQEGVAPDQGLPELLRRCLAGFGGRVALALRLLAPGEPAVIAAYPQAAVDPALMVQIAALLDSHAEVVSAGGCFQGRVTRPAPGAAGHQDGVLIGVARLPGDSCPCALILVAERSRWPAEWQSTARALATVIAARIRRVEDSREIAERRAITDALIGAAPDAVVVADARRKIVSFNPAAERLYGRRRADVTGQGMGDLLIPERNRARFLESTEEFLRSQDPGEYTGRMQLPILRGDGSERTVELTPLPLVVGGQIFFCSFARDLTELERANTALAASEARVRLLSELAPVGIARTDDTGTCAYVNERWCAQNGQLAAAILGTSWLESVHPGDVPRVRREWMRARAAGSELRTDFRLRRYAADPLWVHAAVTPVPDQADLPCGFMVALTNVTARKRAEQERDRLLASERAAVHDLTDQTERLNSLIAAAIPGVLVLDEHSMIVQVNQSLCDLLGIGEPPAKLTGASAEQLRGAIARTFADPGEVEDQIAGRHTARQPVEGLRFACSDGRTMECDYWPVFAEGEYRGGLVLLWDMSERAAREQERDRRLEAELASRRAAEDARRELSEQNEELRELDDLKTRFLATVSHELRSPLTSIVSYAELIREEGELSPTAARFLDVIARNAERITKLVGDLLLLSQIEAGMIPLELAQVSVAELVSEAVQASAPLAAQQGITLDGSAADGPPVLADRARLVQVIDNLIANAVKFTDEGGQVLVSAAAAGGEWRIDVQDSGIGIPADEIGHLFDRFFRASNAATAGRPGSGLGLSIVKEVAELHGGRVEVSSTVGAGTTVSLFLPALATGAQAGGGAEVTAEAITTYSELTITKGNQGTDGPERAGTGSDPVSSVSQPESPGRILVVEDDPEAAAYVLHVLRNRGGFEVTHIAAPAAALDRARAERWDLVLTDVEMPGMTGIELLEAIREITPQLPVAVYTAHASVDYAVRALRNKADEFLEKPVPPDKLVATVTALVARGRAAREAARQSVLAIGAHPDDVEIGAAGTLAMHRRMGHEVSILTLSRGARGGLEDTRASESVKAAEVIGAILYHEDLQDTSIREGDPTIGVISGIVETVRPTVIYTHSLHDVHQDHRNTHLAALVAVRQVGRVYCFQSPSATVDFRPTRFVNIDDELDRKLEAIDAFGSQVEIRAYLEPDLIKGTARYWSRYCEGRYAEPFEVVREAAVAGQHELTPAKGIVRGENGTWAAAPDRRRRPRPDDQVPNLAPEPAPQHTAELTREVPDAAP